MIAWPIRTRWTNVLIAASLAAVAGCAEPVPRTEQGDAANTAPPSPAANVSAAGASTEMPAGPAVAASGVETAADSAEPETERVRAEVGVGQKGRSLDKYDEGVQSVIAQPARSLFAAKERVVFEIQIPKAMQLYKALHGSGPQSHEQFMSEIIEANQIALPQLPSGQRYVYVPETEELMVERPAR